MINRDESVASSRVTEVCLYACVCVRGREGTSDLFVLLFLFMDSFVCVSEREVGLPCWRQSELALKSNLWYVFITQTSYVTQYVEYKCCLCTLHILDYFYKKSRIRRRVLYVFGHVNGVKWQWFLVGSISEKKLQLISFVLSVLKSEKFV